MWKNYFKIALRNLAKYKFISFINLFGLTVGLSCCLLILGFILHELSYDRFHSKADNIYRVNRNFKNAETGIPNIKLASVAPPVGPLLVNDFEEIEKVTVLFPVGGFTFNYGDKKFKEQVVYFADEHLFQVFDVEVIMGNPATALTDPFSIMLTEEMAVKYFGNENPLNKTLRLDNQSGFKVTGVYRAFPDNSHMRPQMMLSFKTLKDPAFFGEEELRTNWAENSFYTYLLLPENFDPEKLEGQFPSFIDRHLSPDASGTEKASVWTSLYLTALTDIHLHSESDGELEETGDMKRVFIFSAIALFILLIACINYMNLSTARSVLRAREIGVRKVIGAGKRELVFQFLTESVLIAWLATIFAFFITWMSFPWLNQLSGLNLSIDILLSREVILPLMLVPFVVGILSGLYPALFLSSFQPVKVLKGFFKTGSGGVSLRQALVVAQFSISIILIISTLVVSQQLDFMQNKALGFDRNQIITFNSSDGVAGNFEAFRNQLLSDGHIKKVARSSRIPSGRLMSAHGYKVNRGDSLAPTQADIRFVQADNYFFSTYGINLLAGRDFSTDFGPDTSAFIINEAAMREMGYKSAEEVIGLEFEYGERKGRLVGVIRDFHFESMHHRILPIVFYKAPVTGGYDQISVKISGENAGAALAKLKTAWNTFDPDIPFEYNFLDDRYARLYQSEERQGKIFSLFAGIAITIACLGLFGLSAFTISQRVKEIGIRKILGAENSSIVALLSKDFLRLVIIAALIAFPVSWYMMNSWLQDFAYRIDVPLWAFLAAGITAALVAFLTVGYQAIKAAMANPVKNLRTE